LEALTLGAQRNAAPLSARARAACRKDWFENPAFGSIVIA
jgi:hypothetical protein